MNTLDRWVGAGLVDPANAFAGHGRHRRYTLSQCVAVAAGARWRAEGAAPERVAGIIRFLSGLGTEWLEAEIEAGRTFPVPAAMLGASCLPGVMIEPPSDPSMGPGVAALVRRLDLAPLCREVKEKVARLSKRPANRRGRNRGLVQSTGR